MIGLLNKLSNKLKMSYVKMANFFIDKKNTINKIYFVSIVVYFFVVFLPNITTGSPLSSFFNEGITKIIYRVFFAVSFGFISIVAFIANDIRLNRLTFFTLLGFLIFLIVGALFNLAPISTAYINGYYEKVIISYSTGALDIITYYGNLLFSYIFCFALFTTIPLIMKDKARLSILLDLFIVTMLILCFISYIKDAKLYYSVLKLNFNQYTNEGISSLFASKNSFGVFLYQGIICSLIAHHFRQQSKYRFLYLIAVSLFSITLIFTLCKDAIFALAIFTIVFLIYLFRKKQKRVIDYALILFWVVLSCLILFLIIALLNQESFKEIPFFKRIYDFMGANPVSGHDNAFIGRLEIVVVFFLSISGIHYLVGYGHALPSNAYIWSLTYRGEGNENLHNTFLHIFGTGGILYFAFYIFMIGYAFYLIFKNRSNDKKIFYLLFGLLASHIFYSLFETSVLFLSGSSATMLFSIILVSLINRDSLKRNIASSNIYCEVTI